MRRFVFLVIVAACGDQAKQNPDAADDKFHVLAVAQTGPNVPAADLGRFTDVAPLLASPFNTAGTYSDNTSTGKLAGIAQDASMKGQFRTKGLRDLTSSGPYMHSGQLATLADVIVFYEQGGGDATALGVTKDPLLAPISLSAQDRTDLAAFLLSLEGQPMDPMRLADTSK